MPRQKLEPKILATSNEWICVDCPSGVSQEELATLFAMSSENGTRRPVPAHRSDVGASGIVLMGYEKSFREAVHEQLVEGRATLDWEVLVRGYVLDETGEITAPLYFDKRSNRMEASRPRGEAATTHYRILQRLPGHTLLNCRAPADRPQQIRVHLASVDYPVVGDHEYGDGEPLLLSRFKRNYRPSKRHEERPLLDRLAMHAAGIAFVDPATEAPICVVAAHHRDFRATIRQLEKL